MGSEAVSAKITNATEELSAKFLTASQSELQNLCDWMSAIDECYASTQDDRQMQATIGHHQLAKAALTNLLHDHAALVRKQQLQDVPAEVLAHLLQESDADVTLNGVVQETACSICSRMRSLCVTGTWELGVVDGDALARCQTLLWQREMWRAQTGVSEALAALRRTTLQSASSDTESF